MIRKTFITGSLLLFVAGMALGEIQTVEDALALIPDGQDVAIDLSEEGLALLEAAIDVLEDALGVTAVFDHTDEDDYMQLEVPLEQKEWVNKLSQAYYTLGDVFLEENAELKDTFARGQYWGLKSLRMATAFITEEVRHGFVAAVGIETDVAALFWTYGNWARKDDLDVLGAIARNDPPKLEALINRTYELDPTYSAYAPYRALAAFWGGLPPLPLIEYGQNLPRALSYACPIIDEPDFCSDCSECPVDPNHEAYLENRLIFVEYYLMPKKLWSDAERVLESILGNDVGEDYVLYNMSTRKRAAEVLEEVRTHLD